MKFRIANQLILCGILVLLSGYASVSAQTVVIPRASVKTKDGFIFIQNGHLRSFTLEFKGKDVKGITAGDNPAFNVDGKVIQLIIVENQSFLNGTKDATEEKLLELHRDWESDYLMKDIYEEKFPITSEPITQDGRKFLLWGFTRPAENSSFDRDYFLTTIVGPGLLGFNVPVPVGASLADYRKLMLEVMSTLKVSDKPFDVLKISDGIRNAPGN
jgi:hypothetical protein